MKKSIYQSAKIELKEAAMQANNYYTNDLPAIRQTINDTADYLCKSLNLSEYQMNLLSDYACKLHPKKH